MASSVTLLVDLGDEQPTQVVALLNLGCEWFAGYAIGYAEETISPPYKGCAYPYEVRFHSLDMTRQGSNTADWQALCKLPQIDEFDNVDTQREQDSLLERLVIDHYTESR